MDNVMYGIRINYLHVKEKKEKRFTIILIVPLIIYTLELLSLMFPECIIKMKNCQRISHIIDNLIKKKSVLRG